MPFNIVQTDLKSHSLLVSRYGDVGSLYCPRNQMKLKRQNEILVNFVMHLIYHKYIYSLYMKSKVNSIVLPPSFSKTHTGAISFRY